MYEVTLILITQVIRDWHLVILIVVIVAVDFVLLGVLAAYEGGRIEATLVVNKENPSDETGVSNERKKRKVTLL